MCTVLNRNKKYTTWYVHLKRLQDAKIRMRPNVTLHVYFLACFSFVTYGRKYNKKGRMWLLVSIFCCVTILRVEMILTQNATYIIAL